MPKNRIGFGSDFVLIDSQIGINTLTPTTTFDVNGNAKYQGNIRSSGITTTICFDGFLSQKQTVGENITIGLENGITGSLSDEIIVATGATVSYANTSENIITNQNRIDKLKVYNTFTVPVGTTSNRPTNPKKGTLYYNKDFSTIEFWDGERWKQVDNTMRGNRGVFAGGVNTPTYYSTIEYVNISSLGNATNFGSLSINNSEVASCSSSIRGLFGSGFSPGRVNNIEYVTIASEGNSIDFGDLTQAKNAVCSFSSSTRGIWAGGGIGPTVTSVNVIEYVQIQTLGNASDFGDLYQARFCSAGLSSPTRGIIAGGGIIPGSIRDLKSIEHVTISSTGNSTAFGDLVEGRSMLAGCSSTTRGIFAGGYTPSSTSGKSTIDHITINSLGNAIDFGDLTNIRSYLGASSNSIRGIFGGGLNPTILNIIDYVLISSSGNALDFGDLTTVKYGVGCLSDSHGGLGGF